MAGNDWINSYLEAILDTGPSIDANKSSLLLRERGSFSPTRYFVEEVITGYDETDLHKTWVRAAATRSTQERNTRLENMCWRIWNLARKKKQIEAEEAHRTSKRRLERERARNDATVDMSEDLSEGEKGDTVGYPSAPGEFKRVRMSRINSVDAIDAWASQYKDKKLYIVLISIHGLVRCENMELGRDSDTGGQVKYVVELARALGSMPGVYRVDLLTRQISAPDVDWNYGEPTEMLTLRCSDDFNQEMGESSGAYIIRIPFGPKEKYVAKELLWPHIQEFVDGALNHVIQMSKVLGAQIGDGEPVWPVAIHGHYADAGNSAVLLSGALNVPMILTGHSLGRDKLEQLLKQGRQTREEINAMYKIMRRIEAEELALDASEIVITSTRQEIDEQWNLYDGFDVILERKLRARIRRGVSCHGRYMPRMVIIPPGMEFNHIAAQDGSDNESEGNEDNAASPDPPIWFEVMRFFTNPRKPMILALSRPDPKKNITTLVKAFGECRSLRELANLTLILGNRDNIDEMSSTNSSVLISILKLIDMYDLYGQVSYPKHHKQSDVPDIYRLAAKTKASANGLPIVATKNGGPVDIHKVLDNGILVDPHDQHAISDALYKLVSDKQLWSQCQQNGLKNIYQFSWPEHCKTYLSKIASCRPRHPRWRQSKATYEDSEPDSPNGSLRDIHDISLNLKFSLDGEQVVSNLRGLGSTGKSDLELAVSKGVLRAKQSSERVDKDSNKLPLLRRKNIIVLAVDSVGGADLIAIIKSLFEASSTDRASGYIGFILSTSLTMSEIHSLLAAGGIVATEFDAFICNSGSELYYPSSNSDDLLYPSELPFALDIDYHSQIEYRWGGEGLRKTLVRWVASVNDKGGSEGSVIIGDMERSSTYCNAFQVKNPSQVPPIKEIQKHMRIQALRCRAVYSHDGSKLNIIPVLASRSQALRYLFVRWGVELSKIIVFVGESGDTDYDSLLGGVHKTVILKGSFNTVPSQLHSTRSYSLKDVVAFDSPNILEIEGCGVNDIQSALRQLGVLKK